MMHPRVLQLIMDSLRYWVTEMHVDGFRFDLAAALARELHDVDRLGAFFDIIHQDPLLSQVKLIAEPWDLGEGGYQVGNFPVGWTEWNGKYRDTVRRYWKGDDGTLGEFAFRLTGSADLYETSGRLPSASVNFVTAHDGFTLHDLVSYNDKHNEANLDDNRDGENHNNSWNCGAEGPTDDAGRERAARAAEAQLPRDAAAFAGRADAARRRRARPHAAGQQQRLLPGQRAQLDRLGRRRRRARRVHRAADRRAQAASDVPAAPLFPGQEPARPGLAVAQSRRRRDDARELGRSVRALRRRAVPRGGVRGAGRARRADHRRRLPAALERALREHRVSPARRHRAGARVRRHGARARPWRRGRRAARPLRDPRAARSRC